MKLKQSKVKYDPIEHTYLLNGIFLSGITGIISRYFFPKKYDGIPKHILENAKEKGHRVHTACELYDEAGLTSHGVVELQRYISICEENGLKHLASEYIVSDEKHVATPIDKVFEAGKNLVDIGDIKTTYSLDKEYLSWQLSICAYLFELQNKRIKVNKLYAIWLREDKDDLVEIERKSDQAVIDLLTRAAYDIDNEVQVVVSEKVETEVPASVYEAEQSIINFEKQIKDISEQRDKLKAGLLDLMIKNNVFNYKTDRITLTRKAPYEKVSIDSKRLKAEYPDLYDEYSRKSKVKESLTITIK